MATLTAPADLRPPAGFVPTPHPPVAGPEKLVSRCEEIVIDRPVADVIACMDEIPLADWIDRSGKLPGVLGTHVLEGERYRAPGSRHMVFLTDGTTVVEEVLEDSRTPTSRRFRYVVWEYSTPAAKPLRYGLGDFLYTGDGETHTNVRWRYSFELKPDQFPGFLGPKVGGFLLRKVLLDGDYAAWMSGSLRLIKAHCEAWKG